MDNFAEYMVKKQPDSRDIAKKAGIIALAVLLSAASVFLVFITHIPFIPIITCAVIYGAYFVLTGLSVEYEYAVTNRYCGRRKNHYRFRKEVKNRKNVLK